MHSEYVRKIWLVWFHRKSLSFFIITYFCHVNTFGGESRVKDDKLVCLTMLTVTHVYYNNFFVGYWIDFMTWIIWLTSNGWTWVWTHLKSNANILAAVLCSSNGYRLGGRDWGFNYLGFMLYNLYSEDIFLHLIWLTVLGSYSNQYTC